MKREEQLSSCRVAEIANGTSRATRPSSSISSSYDSLHIYLKVENEHADGDPIARLIFKGEPDTRVPVSRVSCVSVRVRASVSHSSATRT